MHTGNPYLDRNRALYAAVCTVHRYQFSDFSRDVYLSEKGYLESVTKSRLRERKIPMLKCDYEVKQIDGDYAHLQRIDRPEEELKLVARALLPMEIYEGCILHYEMMQYSMK